MGADKMIPDSHMQANKQEQNATTGSAVACMYMYIYIHIYVQCLRNAQKIDVIE